MVLGKIKDMITGGGKGKSSGTGSSKNISKVSGLEEEPETNKSPITTRRKRENLDMPSPEDLPEGGGSRRRSPGRDNPQPARSRRRDTESRRDTSRRNLQKPDRMSRPTRDRRTNSGRRNFDERDETKEMLQEILRKLEDIDRKLGRRR